LQADADITFPAEANELDASIGLLRVYDEIPAGPLLALRLR